MMKRSMMWALLSAALAVSATDLGAASRMRWLVATLEPRFEVPAVASPGSGVFIASIDDEAKEIEFSMTFRNLQSTVTQSHIHFAQPNVNGGIVIWLCGTATNPGPAETQTCPQSGTITGTIRAGNVLGVAAQGIAAGDFDKIVDNLRAGLGYANIHTMQSPGGEIRGQLKAQRTSRR
jgi:hypothetical protein